jgi:hypothetical protein
VSEDVKATGKYWKFVRAQSKKPSGISLTNIRLSETVKSIVVLVEFL